MLELRGLYGATESRRLRLRDLCRTQPDRKQWSAVMESTRVGSYEIMKTLNGVRSGMFVEEPVTGKVGILWETWWEAVEAAWVGAVEWLPGTFSL